MKNTTLLQVQTLGDPHLGKTFKTGVPVHRLGEREGLVQADFRANLVPRTGVTLHVCMGDLFDKFRVPEEIILFAANAYKEAAFKYPDVLYVIIRGNHDASRDVTLKSSFDVFSEIVSSLENIRVVSDEPETIGDQGKTHCFYPWHPFINAKEMVELMLPPEAAYVYGHWDIASFGEDSSSESNLIPLELLQNVTLATTGHYHVQQTKLMNGVPVIVTGSMQPYSHSEDLDGTHYITVSKEDALLAPKALKNLNVRILLEQGEMSFGDLDCCSLTFKKLAAKDAPELVVDIDNFDIEDIFETTFAEFHVGKELTTKLWQKFTELNTND
jgi:DNA repair exonuclease SbcCD nuclease subunit